MILISREQPAHFYTRSGQPFHTVPKKDGSGDRPATVADARKMDLIPSVTNILGVIGKPGLEAWKIEQGILSALTLQRLPDETLDAFAHRVASDSQEQVAQAAGLGTDIHAAVEEWVVNRKEPSPSLMPYLKDFMVWWRENVEELHASEIVLVGNGYAGRADLIIKVNGKYGIWDVKTQGVKKGKPNFYETWPLQLEAYRHAIKPIDRGDYTEIPSDCGSIVISTNSDSPGFWIKEWPDHAEYWRAFQAAQVLWSYVKGYDPTKNASDTPSTL